MTANSNGNEEPGREAPDDEQAAQASPEAAEGELEQAGGKDVVLSRTQYEELKTLAAERDEYLKRLQHAVADHLNLQKRVNKMKEMAGREALKRVARRVVPLADSLARALDAAEQTEGAEKIAEGLRLMQDEFYAMLDSLNIQPIEAVGTRFNPEYHEAVMQQPTEDAAPNTVVKELKKGFLLGDELLRPTQVIVASAPQKDNEQ